MSNDPTEHCCREMAGGLQPLTHVGQTYYQGRTGYEVRELAGTPDDLRLVVSTLRETVQQHAGAWGVGYASSCEMSTASSFSEWEFRREGQGLRVAMRTVASAASSMRVLDSYSTGREQKLITLSGLLSRR